MEVKYGPYSPSRLDVGMCGHWFKKQYIDTVSRGYEDLAAARGAAAHEVLEKINLQLRDDPNRPFTENLVHGWVVEAIKNHPAAYAEVDLILDMCRRYIQRPVKEINPECGVEVKLAVAINQLPNGDISFTEVDYDDPRAFFRGRLDVLVLHEDNKTATITDHKTQPNIVPLGDTFQLGCYAWMLWKTHPYLQTIKTVIHFARYGCYSDAYEWSLEDLKAIENQILVRASILESTVDWKATPNDLCQYCPYIVQCPVMSEFIDYDPELNNYKVKINNVHCLGDMEKANKLAAAAYVVDEWLGVVKKNIREHIKMYETPITINNITWGFKPSSGPDWDKVNKKLKPMMLEIFKKHGVDPTIFMSFNQSTTTPALDPLRIDGSPLAAEIDRIIPIKSSTSFAAHKNF